MDGRLLKNGCNLSAVELVLSPSGHGFSARATQPIDKGQAFMVIPRRLVLDEGQAAEGPMGPVISELYAKHGRRRLRV